jgi:hypothetical protein
MVEEGREILRTEGKITRTVVLALIPMPLFVLLYIHRKKQMNLILLHPIFPFPFSNSHSPRFSPLSIPSFPFNRPSYPFPLHSLPPAESLDAERTKTPGHRCKTDRRYSHSFTALSSPDPGQTGHTVQDMKREERRE